jgi:acetyl esterase/lipase
LRAAGLIVAAVLAATAAACGPPAAGQGAQASLAGHAAARIAYGPGVSQFGELWLPKGPGPHAVAVLLHGGCWQASVASLDMMNPMAQALQARGYAVWNLEYTRLGEDGGYPRTFTDAGAGLDRLRLLAKTYPLDLGRVVIIGHSAGGHLALWLAARRYLPAGSVLKATDPLLPKAVVSLAGIGDLAAFAAEGPGACHEASTVPALVGKGRADPFADTSPIRLLPSRVPTLMVSGDHDSIVPPIFGSAFVRAAAAKGDEATTSLVAAGDHFALINPKSDAFALIVPRIDRLAR